MKRLLIGLALGLILTFAVAVANGERLILAWHGYTTKTKSLTALQAELEPHMIVTLPKDAGDNGPVPAVLQFHGCAGARLPFQEMYGRIANAAGYASVIVDSNRPRGFNREQALEMVCTGKAMLGLERAGDVLAAFDLIAARDDIDGSQIVLAGWSHGAWTVMDYFTTDISKTRLAALDTPYAKPAPRIAGAILFYPHCGLGALSRVRRWQQTPPTLVLIAGADTIVNHEECLSLFNDLETEQGLPVQRTVYPQTEHAFDDPFIEPDWQHWHNAEHMRDAMGRYESFLTALSKKSD